jgi:hypothetical protein
LPGQKPLLDVNQIISYDCNQNYALFTKKGYEKALFPYGFGIKKAGINPAPILLLFIKSRLAF